MQLLKKIVLGNKYLTFLWLLKQNGNPFEKLNSFLGTDEFVKIIPASKDGNGINYDIALDNPNDGFFALTRWTLDYLYFADNHGFNPSVKWGNCLYTDKSKNGTDAFEYFFNPILLNENPKSRAFFEKKQRKSAEDLNNNIYYCYSKEYISALADTMAKYLIFNETVREKIDIVLKQREISENVLGVHIRGTDYKKNYKNHPKYISPEEYYPYIDEALKTGNFEKIYIATDDEDILSEFKAHYGQDRLLYAKDVNRGTGTEGIHINAKSPYNAGLEVICDMACLSYCGGIISSLSQVGLFARIYKESNGAKFREDIIVSNGINTSGKTFSAKH